MGAVSRCHGQRSHQMRHSGISNVLLVASARDGGQLDVRALVNPLEKVVEAGFTGAGIQDDHRVERRPGGVGGFDEPSAMDRPARRSRRVDELTEAIGVGCFRPGHMDCGSGG